MKVLVTKPFRDKETKAMYEAGQVIDMTKTRFNKAVVNLKKYGGDFVEEVEERKGE